MSTIQKRFENVNGRIVVNQAVRIAEAIGPVAGLVSFMLLYAIFTVVAVEVLTAAGFYEALPQFGERMIGLAFNIPPAAVMGLVAAYVHNAVADDALSYLRVASATTGAWFAVGMAHVVLLAAGVV